MTPRHDSFTLTRHVGACRDHVWAVWADPALKRLWFVDHDGTAWRTLRYEHDFRIGGRERGAWEGGEGPGKGVHENETVFLDIAEAERIVYAYTMAKDGRIHSASLATLTLADRGGGTELTYTEQMTLIGDGDGMGGRRDGWAWLLDTMETTLRETAQ